jgi:hypothetical protein
LAAHTPTAPTFGPWRISAIPVVFRYWVALSYAAACDVFWAGANRHGLDVKLNAAEWLLLVFFDKNLEAISNLQDCSFWCVNCLNQCQLSHLRFKNQWDPASNFRFMLPAYGYCCSRFEMPEVE